MRHHLQTLFSTLFRLFSYIFLRIIPTRLANPTLPILYIAHVLSVWLCPPPAPSANKEKGNRPAVQSSPVAVLCFSLPSYSRSLNLVNIFANTLLLLAAADLAFSPFFDSASQVVFTRVGAVYPDKVNIVVRYPNQAAVLILYRESQSALWKKGPEIHLHNQSDWVGTISLDNLWPSTSYEYTLAYSNQSILPHLQRPIQFRTFPDPGLQNGSVFRFIATSCITPNFPYRGPLHRQTITGFDLLADYLSLQSSLQQSHIPTQPAHANTEFLLFLGDFIYADVPLYIGDDPNAYRKLYRRNYQSPSFRKVYEQLPIFHAYDDHEFVDNYVGNAQDVPPFPNAFDAYKIYTGNANYDSPVPGQSFYDFRYGDIAFFVLDTRRYRSAGGPSPTMLGAAQLTALSEWLHRVNLTCSFKFVVSSVPFTSLWTLDAQIDSWAAFSAEKAKLLEAFHSVPNVIIISGDRHEFAAIEFATSDSNMHVVREFSTSPLNMFYLPFTNTLRLRSQDSFTRNLPLPENGTIEVPFEKAIAYIPHGNSKWSTFDVDTRDLNKPILRVETVIDGKKMHYLEIIATPNRPSSFTSLGMVATSVKDLLDKIGLKARIWF